MYCLLGGLYKVYPNKMSGPTITATLSTSKWPTLETGKLTVVPLVWGAIFHFDKTTLTLNGFQGFTPGNSGTIRIVSTNTVTGVSATSDFGYTGFNSGAINVPVWIGTAEGPSGVDDPTGATNPVARLHTCTIQFYNDSVSDWTAPATSSAFDFTPVQHAVWGQPLFTAQPGTGKVIVSFPDATYNGVPFATDGGKIFRYTDQTTFMYNESIIMEPNTSTTFGYQCGANLAHGTTEEYTWPSPALICGVPQSAELYLADVVSFSATAALDGTSPVSITFDTTPGTSLTKARIKKPGQSQYSWVPIVIDNGTYTATNALTGNEIFVVLSGTEKQVFYDNYPNIYNGDYIVFGAQNVNTSIYGITNKFSTRNSYLGIKNFEKLNNNAFALGSIPYHGQAKTKIVVNGIEKTPTIVKVSSYNYLPEIAAALAQDPSNDIILVLTLNRFTSYQSDSGLITWQERSGTIVRNYLSETGTCWYFSSNQFLLNEYTVKYYNGVYPDTLLYGYPLQNGTSMYAVDRRSYAWFFANLTSQKIISQSDYEDNDIFYFNTTGSSLYLLDLSSSTNTSLVVPSSTTTVLKISSAQAATLNANTFYLGTVDPTWTSVVVPTGLTGPSVAIVWQESGTWHTNLDSVDVQAGSTGTVTPTVTTLCYNISGATLNYAYTPGSGATASSGTLAAGSALYVDAGSTVDFTTDGPAPGSTTYTVDLLDGTSTTLTLQSAPVVGQQYTDNSGNVGLWNTISSTSSSLTNSGSGDFFFNASGSTMYFYSNYLPSAQASISVPQGAVLFVSSDDAIILGITDYIFSTVPLSAITTVGPSPPSYVYVWSTGSGNSTVWHSAVSGTSALINDLSAVPSNSTVNSGFVSINASSRPVVAYNSTNSNMYYKWPTQGQSQYTLVASRALYVSASTAKFYMTTEQMVLSAPSFIASQLTLAGTTPFRTGKPVVTLPSDSASAATSSFGSIVKRHIDSGDLTGAGIQDAVTAVTTGGRMAVKFHMDYTRILEDAIDKKIVAASTSAFVYSGSINLAGATGLTAPVAATLSSPAIPGTPGVLTFNSSNAIVTGSYFKTSGGQNNGLYNVTITGPSSFSSTVNGVSNLDALVWNGTSFDNLASFDSAVTVGGDAGTTSSAYLSVDTDPSSDGYIVHFNSSRLASEIQAALTSAETYTDEAVGTIPANMAPPGLAAGSKVTVAHAVDTLLSDIASETNRARKVETFLAESLQQSMATAKQRLQLLEAFMYTTEQYMELTDASGAALDFGNQIAAYTTSGPLASDVISSALPGVTSWPVALTGSAGQTSQVSGPSSVPDISSVNLLTA